MCVLAAKKEMLFPEKQNAASVLLKKRAYSEKKRREKGIVPISFMSPTICSRCKKTKPDNGSKLCPKCYADALKALEKAHRCQSNKDHIWYADNKIALRRYDSV